MPRSLSEDVSSALKSRSPRGEARCRAVLDAARELLIEGGPAAVCVNEVGRRAGGSLATIYRHFGSREGLLEALFVSVANDLVDVVDDEDLTRRPPAEALALMGEACLRRVLQPDALAVHRALVTEGPHHPTLREAVLRLGPMRVRERLADYLAAQARAGALRITDPRRSAAQFLALVMAGIHLEALSGEPVDTSRRALTAHVAAAVRQFLEGCASPAAPPPPRPRTRKAIK
jgi:AcrR family transcriptional regulator